MDMGMMSGSATSAHLTIEVVKAVTTGQSVKYTPDNIFGSTNKLVVQYNPDNLSYSLGQQIAENREIGSNQSVQTPTGKKEDKISFSLIFDTSMSRGTDNSYMSVWDKYVKNYELLVSNDESGQVPICKVTWGSIINFIGTLENLKINYTLFSPDGKPLRARLELTFMHKGISSNSSNSSAQIQEKVRTRKLNPGEYIGLLAILEYGDPNKWKSVAAANNVDNPRLTPPGTDIYLPLE